jgi:K+-transporting ATPase ATPase C chain
MREYLRPTIILLAAFTVLTGLIYPLAVTAVAQLAFPHQANGSLIVRNGQTLGSSLIGQQFDAPRYFWGRPSATADYPYNAALGSGRNWGPLNPALKSAVAHRIETLQRLEASNTAPIPVDLVTASASGLDPHVSPAAAEYQVARVARLRGLPVGKVRALVAQWTEPRQWGFLGEPRVNVLKLNLALDAAAKTGSVTR